MEQIQFQEFAVHWKYLGKEHFSSWDTLVSQNPVFEGRGVKSNPKLKKLTFSYRIEFFNPDFVVQGPKDTISGASWPRGEEFWVATSDIFRVTFYSGNLKKMLVTVSSMKFCDFEQLLRQKIENFTNFLVFCSFGTLFFTDLSSKGGGGVFGTPKCLNLKNVPSLMYMKFRFWVIYTYIVHGHLQPVLCTATFVVHQLWWKPH